MPRTRYFDLTHQQFGKLFVQNREEKTRNGAVVWKCLCDCGEVTYVISANLRNGTTNSCGCLRRRAISEMKKTHGMTKSKTYKIWSGMKTRCLNPNSTNYSLYGGRGIKVCKKWEFFEGFFEDMGECPDGLSLDRINVNGNYNLKNCRWATNQEQASNKRKTKLLNKYSFVEFLQSQIYLSKEQKKMLANNLFENQHS